MNFLPCLSLVDQRRGHSDRRLGALWSWVDGTSDPAHMDDLASPAFNLSALRGDRCRPSTGRHGSGSALVLDSARRERLWYLLRVNPLSLIDLVADLADPALDRAFACIVRDQGLAWERTEKIERQSIPLIRSQQVRQSERRSAGHRCARISSSARRPDGPSEAHRSAAHAAAREGSRTQLQLKSGQCRKVTSLITGGAGFIGSHLVDDAAASEASTSRCSTACCRRFTPTPRWTPTAGRSTSIRRRGASRATSWTTASSSASLAGITHLAHLAASVGVGQSMTNIVDYTRNNTMAAARHAWKSCRSAAIRVERMAVASSMSIYGEGAY